MVPVLQRKLNSVPQTFLMKSSLGNSDEINLIVALSVVAKPRGEHKETNSKEMKSNGQITTKWPFI